MMQYGDYQPWMSLPIAFGIAAFTYNLVLLGKGLRLKPVRRWALVGVTGMVSLGIAALFVAAQQANPFLAIGISVLIGTMGPGASSILRHIAKTAFAEAAKSLGGETQTGVSDAQD